MGTKTASPDVIKLFEAASSRNMMGENAETEKFVFAYVDDIIVYSKTEEEHAKHITDILRRIKNNLDSE
jgi:hypothetical protein